MAPYGQVRRAPTGFAHAIRIQSPDEYRWIVIDLYGDTSSFDGLFSDEDVSDWPIVYTPVSDEEWEKN